MSEAKIGVYRIIRKLGEGGMGAVFEALHEEIERRVAIKILHHEFARNADITRRFFNEARAVNRIAHPSLVQISDYGQLPDGTAYIVMEYLSGETLGRRLRRLGGRLGPATVLHLGWQIAAALTAAHEKNIVHRDLKPENIMLVPDPMVQGGERAKLLDFGIAKLAAEAKGTAERTGSEVIMGTPMYMSPEQCRGAGIVDGRTDVYSLGVMLYQMLAGRPPFVGEGSGELIGMHLFCAPPALQELAPRAPASLVVLVHRLLEKEREGRPTMRQVADELELLQAPAGSVVQSAAEVSAAEAVMAEPPTALPLQHSTLGRSVGQRNLAPPPRRTALAVALAVGILAMGGAAGWVRSLPRWQQSSARQAAPSVPAVETVSGSQGSSAQEQPDPAAAPAEPVDPRPDSPEPPAALAVRPPRSRPTTVRWSVGTVPPGAWVVAVDSGEVLGQTPWRSERPKNEGTYQVRLQHRGYADKLVMLSRRRSVDLMEQLEPLKARPASPAPTGNPSPPRPPARAFTPPVENSNAVPTELPFKIRD